MKPTTAREALRRFSHPVFVMTMGHGNIWFQQMVSSAGLHTACCNLREGRMRKSAIRLLTLAICTTALAVVPVITPAKAATSGKHIKAAASSKHIKRHAQTRHVQRSVGSLVHKRRAQESFGFSDPRPAGPAVPSCPGNGRSFECATWPPPMDEDPDRKTWGTDGG
jgi:hypothetical protein